MNKDCCVATSHGRDCTIWRGRGRGRTWGGGAGQRGHTHTRTCSTSQTPSALPMGGADCPHLRGLPTAVSELRGANAHHCLHHAQRRNPPHPEPHRGGLAATAHNPGTRATAVGGLRRAGG